jgi:hypothetical protein
MNALPRSLRVLSLTVFDVVRFGCDMPSSWHLYH